MRIATIFAALALFPAIAITATQMSALISGLTLTGALNDFVSRFTVLFLVVVAITLVGLVGAAAIYAFRR